MNKELNFKKTYKSQNGMVIGKLWGGGLGGYPSRDFRADTEKELKDKISKAFNLGTLDVGMGFEKLVAAGVQIVETTTVEIDGKVFTSTETKNWIIGDVDLFNDLVDAGKIYDDLGE